MPLAAPVTTATLPRRSFMRVSPPFTAERYPAGGRRSRRTARALLFMADGKRTAPADRARDDRPIVPARRHGVIGMTRHAARRGVRVSLCVIARDEAAEPWARCLESAARRRRRDRRRRHRLARRHVARRPRARRERDRGALDGRLRRRAEHRRSRTRTAPGCSTLDADETLTPDAAESLAPPSTEPGAPALRLPIEEVGATRRGRAPSTSPSASSGASPTPSLAAADLRARDGGRDRVRAAADPPSRLRARRSARYAKLDRNRAAPRARRRGDADRPASCASGSRGRCSRSATPYAAAAHAEAALRRTRSTMTGLLAIDTLARARLRGRRPRGRRERVPHGAGAPARLDRRAPASSPRRRSGPARSRRRCSTTRASWSTASGCSLDVTWPVRLPRLVEPDGGAGWRAPSSRACMPRSHRADRVTTCSSARPERAYQSDGAAGRPGRRRASYAIVRVARYFADASSSSMTSLNFSNGCAPTSMRPLTKNAGVPVTPSACALGLLRVHALERSSCCRSSRSTWPCRCRESFRYSTALSFTFCGFTSPWCSKYAW